MNTVDGIQELYAASLHDWRNWLAENGEKQKAVWLIFYHKSSAISSVHWHEAIEHALCFGWVDSKAQKRDKESCYLKFTPRNPKSKWGKRNKERVAKMIDEGFMTEPACA